jgi:hypothetical protein
MPPHTRLWTDVHAHWRSHQCNSFDRPLWETIGLLKCLVDITRVNTARIPPWPAMQARNGA